MFSLTAIIYALSFSASCLAAGMKLDFDALESESTTFAVTQVKNPNWVSQPITTTEVYARSFLVSYDIPAYAGCSCGTPT